MRGERSRWVQHRAPSRAAPIVAAVIGVLSVGGASAFSVWSIERDLEERTTEALRAEGVDLSGVRVDFSYRDGTIDGAEAGDVGERRLDQTTGVRTLEYLMTEAVTADTATTDAPLATDEPSANSADVEETAPDAETPPPVTTPPAPDAGQVSVLASVSNEEIVLSGSVRSDEQRQELVDAAVTRVGSDNVVDDLIVVQTGSDGPLSGLASLLINLPASALGTIDLDGDNLSFVGTVESMEAADQLAEILDATERSTALELDIVDVDPADEDPDVPVETTPNTTTSTTTTTTSVPLDAPGGVSDGEVAELQAALDELAPNIAQNVVFTSSSDDINADAATALNDVVELLNEYPEVALIVTGHTDDRGDEETNRILSASRAEAVVLYLSGQGIALERLQFAGAGESQPIADNSTQDGQRANRRVELTAIGTL